MPKNIYKSANSFQNIVLLLLFVIGMFVLYRYVKTIESETKILQNHLIELTEKMNEIMSHRQDNMPVHSVESVVGKNTNASLHRDVYATTIENTVSTDHVVDETDYDNESVKSADITNMLKKVMMGSLDDDDDDTIISNIVSDVKNDGVGNPPNTISIEEIEDENEEDIVISKTQTSNEKDVLFKKTNEELKTMLKNKSLSTKGSKAELVDRLITSNM